MISSTDATGAIKSVNFDMAGNLVEVLEPNGNPISYGYDQFNRLISQTNAIGDEKSYNYDRVGNLLSKQKPVGSIMTGKGHRTIY